MFGKGFDDLITGSRKYFSDPKSFNNWSELPKNLIDAADLNQWLTEKPKAKEVWDKSLNYADVLWQYRAPSKLPIPFPDEVEVKLLDGKYYATCKMDGTLHGMVLEKGSDYFSFYLADKDHKEELGVEFYLFDDGYVYWVDKSTGEKVWFEYDDTKELDVVNPFKKKGVNYGKYIPQREEF